MQDQWLAKEKSSSSPGGGDEARVSRKARGSEDKLGLELQIARVGS